MSDEFPGFETSSAHRGRDGWIVDKLRVGINSDRRDNGVYVAAETRVYEYQDGPVTQSILNNFGTAQFSIDSIPGLIQTLQDIYAKFDKTVDTADETE